MTEVLAKAGRGVIVLAAGGTGGHLFPAQALAEELGRRGYVIHLITDERVADYGKNFPAREIHVVPSATLSFSKPWLLPQRLLRLASGEKSQGDIARVEARCRGGLWRLPIVSPHHRGFAPWNTLCHS